jgi:hypothetical protein
MSDSAPTPAQDTATPSIDTQQLQQPPPPQSLVQDPQLHAQLHQTPQPTISDPPRKRAFQSLLPVAISSCSPLPPRIVFFPLTSCLLFFWGVPFFDSSKSPSRKACMHFLSFWKDSLQRDPSLSGMCQSISAFYVCQRRDHIILRVALSVVLVPPVPIQIQRLPLTTHNSRPLVRLR